MFILYANMGSFTYYDITERGYPNDTLIAFDYEGRGGSGLMFM